MKKGTSFPIFLLVVGVVITTIALGYITFFTGGGPETKVYHLSVSPKQQGSDLVISGKTNLPENSELKVEISPFGFSKTVKVTENQYQVMVERSVNALSKEYNVSVSFSPINQADYVKKEVGDNGKLMRGTLVDNSGNIWSLENENSVYWSRVNSPPNADFSYQVNEHTVEFSDNSSDGDGTITSWQWDLGTQDKISENQNPTLTYGTPGIYETSLLVTDNAGASAKHVENIEITFTFHFTWDYIHPHTEVKEKFHQKITILDELEEYEKVSHGVFIESDIRKLITPKDKIIENIANGLKENYLDKYSWNDVIFADFVLEFVQDAIPYSRHPYENAYWWPYAPEVLEKGVGSCTGKSLLFASLAEALEYDACVIDFPSDQHMIGGIRSLDGTASPSIASGLGYTNVEILALNKNGQMYWPAETTGPIWTLGEVVTGLSNDWEIIHASP